MPIGAARASVLSGGDAIPDSGLLHSRYDATELSLSDSDPVSTWPDEAGSNDLTAGTAPTYRASQINGNPAVEFDGSTTYLDVDFSSSISQPIHTYHVSSGTDNTDRDVAQDGFTSAVTKEYRYDNSDYQIFNGSALAGGTPPSGTVEIYTAIYDGANSSIRINGSTVASGDAGDGSTEPFDGHTMGARRADAGGGRHLDGVIGEVLVYDGEPVPSEVESYLADKWGITL